MEISTYEREDVSLLMSLIFKIVGLQQKLRFQEKGEVLRILEIERFLVVTTLKRLGYHKHRGFFFIDR